jgi:hypothetical protein
MYKKINVNLIHDWAISSVVVLKACCQRFSCFSRGFSLLDKEEDGGGGGLWGQSNLLPYLSSIGTKF